MSVHRSAGRPRQSSRAMLEEAAAELFLEQTYAGTTIGDITQRAGVSRNTFFNYFTAKSDLLWVDVDAGLAEVPAALAEYDGSEPVTTAVRRAILRVAGGFGPGRVPWAVTQYEVMATSGELEASALTRFLALSGRVFEFLRARRATTDTAATDTDTDTADTAAPDTELLARAFATAVVAAAAAGAVDWAGAGVHRGDLAPYVDRAITPVCAGFHPLLDARGL